MSKILCPHGKEINIVEMYGLKAYNHVDTDGLCNILNSFSIDLTDLNLKVYENTNDVKAFMAVFLSDGEVRTNYYKDISEEKNPKQLEVKLRFIESLFERKDIMDEIYGMFGAYIVDTLRVLKISHYNSSQYYYKGKTKMSILNFEEAYKKIKHDLYVRDSKLIDVVSQEIGIKKSTLENELKGMSMRVLDDINNMDKERKTMLHKKIKRGVKLKHALKHLIEDYNDEADECDEDSEEYENDMNNDSDVINVKVEIKRETIDASIIGSNYRQQMTGPTRIYCRCERTRNQKDVSKCRMWKTDSRLDGLVLVPKMLDSRYASGVNSISSIFKECELCRS